MNSVTSDHSLEICLAAVRFYPAYAGPAVRFQRYAAGLRARDIQMQVFTCSDNTAVEGTDGHPAEGRALATQAAAEWIDGIPVTRAPLVYKRAGNFWLNYGRLLAQHCQKSGTTINVVQLLTVNHWLVPSLIRLRQLGIRLVYTDTMVRVPSGNAWKRALKNFVWKLPHHFVDCIVVSSKVMRDVLLEQGIDTRIETIPNGVDVQRFCPPTSKTDRDELRAGLGLDPASEMILFIGYLNHRKGLDILAEAWARLSQNRPAAHLVLISPSVGSAGLGDPSFVNWIKSLLSRSGTGDRVTFLGPVTNVDDYLRAADIFAFPSRREGMPNVVPEAFACGVATVMAPFAGLPDEFGRAGEHYLLVERTPAAFASAIEVLLDDPTKRNRIGRQARAWVEAKLSLDDSLDKYAELYRGLADR